MYYTVMLLVLYSGMYLMTKLEEVIFSVQLKPIFHCDAKPFTLGPGVGLDP